MDNDKEIDYRKRMDSGAQSPFQLSPNYINNKNRHGFYSMSGEKLREGFSESGRPGA
jgi:hypothetical protein